MRNSKRLLAFFMALTMILGFTGCGSGPAQTTEPVSTQAEEKTTEGTTAAPTQETSEAVTTEPADTEADYTEEFPPIEDGCNQLVLYWHADRAVDINTSDVWIWWGDVAGKGYTFLPCAYGFKCVVNVPEDVKEVGFIVRTGCSDPGGTSWGSATKDFEADRFAVITGKETHIYLATAHNMAVRTAARLWSRYAFSPRPGSFRPTRSAIR